MPEDLAGEAADDDLDVEEAELEGFTEASARTIGIVEVPNTMVEEPLEVNTDKL